MHFVASVFHLRLLHTHTYIFVFVKEDQVLIDLRKGESFRKEKEIMCHLQDWK